MAARVVVGEDVVGKIRVVDREFMDGVAAKDAARVAANYSEDARILMPGRPMITGKGEILAFWKAALDGLVDRVTLDTTHIEVSGDLAFALGKNTILLKSAGESPREEKGKYVGVYRREPAGDWKLVVDSYSSNQ